MPAPIIYGACGACGHRKMGRACLRPIIHGACGACGEEEGACAPLFTMPAVPAAKSRVPAPHYLQCLRCLWRKGGCLRPILYNACGACGEEEGACAPSFTMPAVPAAKKRVSAPHYLPCMRRLRRQRGCLRSSIHNVSPSRSDDGNDDDDVLVAGLLMMIACGDGDGGVSHPFCCLDQICTKERNNIFYVDSVLMAGARSFSAAREWIQADGPGVWTLVI